MTAPLRVGLIGCGRAVERLWLPAFRAVPEARVVSAADLRAERRQWIAGRVPGCRVFTDAEALIAAGDVDGLIIVTEPQAHGALARLGLEAGLPLLVEKPLAATVAEASDLDAVRHSTGTPLMVGLNRRWWQPARRLRDLLRSRESGAAQAELVLVTEALRWGALGGVPDLLDDLGTHQFDLLRFLFREEIDSVTATRTNASEITMEVRLGDGTAARCRVAHDGSPEESIRVTAGSLRAWVHANSDRLAPAEGAWRSAHDLAGRAWRKLSGRRSALQRSFEYELRGFVTMIRDGREPSPGTGDAIAAARAVAAARESLALDGLPVKP